MQDNTMYKKALDNAIASVEMEGYQITDIQKDFCLNFVKGKITKAEFVKLMLERCTG